MPYPSIIRKIFWLFLLLLLFCGCEQIRSFFGDPPYKYSFSYFAPMENYAYVRAEITLGFSTQDGVLEVQRKKERIHYAMDLIVRPYTGVQMLDDGKRLRKIIERVTENILETPVKRIDIAAYEVSFKEGEAPAPEELTPKKKLPQTFHGD